tara:strand:+ start:1170 stop:1361 length:192 start_codon:yes stop_codon:yes gene_type:complete
MVKKKAKKKTKKKSPLDKIKKELDKLETLHAKEEAIIDNISEIIEDENDINMPEYSDRWEGTD